MDRSRLTDLKEISGEGITAVVDGTAVAVGNKKLMERLGIEAPLCHTAGTIVHVAAAGRYLGHIVLGDVVRPASAQAVADLRKSGVGRIVMLTGDTGSIARQTGAETGISEVYASLLPTDKVSRLEAIIRSEPAGSKTAYVGDGINDAPVLSLADVGIAMGAMGSDAAIEAADVVLMDDNPTDVGKAIRISRKCLRIVRENIVMALGIKGICLILGVMGIVNMWLAVFADVGVMVLAVLNAIRAMQTARV